MKFIKWTPENIQLLVRKVGSAAKVARMLDTYPTTVLGWAKGIHKPNRIYWQGLNYVALKYKFEPKRDGIAYCCDCQKEATLNCLVEHHSITPEQKETKGGDHK